MSNKEELVFVNCIHEGCKSQRMFMRHPKEKLPEYVCTKHRRLHRVIPEIDSVVIKSGFLLKKGAHSSSFTKRCVVLLADRLVVYENVGDPIALACINLQNSFIEQDRTIKRRFTISCRSEKRKFSFESVLDCDHAEWFHSIQTNIENLEEGEDFKSIDEDDYVSPGVQITAETKRPSDLKKHHAYAMKKLQEKLKPRLLNNVKGDDNNTLTLDIWTGTWNMGECDPPFNLEEWVPNSFDLIAVGVEECMKLPDLEMRCNGVIGSDYVYYTEKVGSTRKEVGFHGYIAVIVFIRIELIQCGLIPANEIVTKNVALGKNLVVTRASNKGGVRVRCPLDLRIFNMKNAIQTQVDFICCHLASDQKGVSKIAKRNKNAVELVQSLVLDDSGDRKGFVFIMGDMNYRIDMQPEQCLQLIVEGVGKQNPDAFFALLDNDQLTPCLATSATFPGFQELTLPSFAPTYKRKKNEEGDPKGYTDLQVVSNCYDHEMKDAGATRRTPSFTDRILFQAYPTDIQSMLYIFKYNEIDYIRDSDHSPVYGATSLRIGPNANKGHIFKKIIPTIPRQTMLESVVEDTMFRVLINNRGLVEPMRKQLLSEAFQFFSPSYIHRDTLIIKAGDSTSCSLLFIVKGSVKLVTEKYELTTLGPGQWFGGQALIEDHCGYTAIAEEDTVCLSLNESALERMIKKGYREFALSIKRMLMGQCIPGLLAIFDDLISDYDEDTLNLLNYQLATTYMEKDTVICKEGEDLATAFYVIGGQISVTMKTAQGDDKLIAMLGPGAVVGTELLTEGATCLFQVKTNSACLFRSLTREDYRTYLTLDTEQQEAGKMYDQRMYHWVNSHELPLNGMKQQLLKLICDIFGGIYIQTGKSIWDPSMKARKLTRVIINGKAALGKEEVAAAPKESGNEFDVDIPVVSSSQSKIVGNGCILNQFDEPLKAIQDCMVLDLDKKELKKLCMLLRWRYFGVGATNLGIPTKEVDFHGYGGLQVCVNDIDGIKPVGAVHVILTSLDVMGQSVIGEEFQTKDIRMAPYYWAESFRFGAGSMGIEAIAAIKIQVIQGLGHVIGEGMLTMDYVFTHLEKDGYLRHVVKLKNPHGMECNLFFTMKALSPQEVLASLEEMPLEDIAVSRQPIEVQPAKQDLRGMLNVKNIKEMANLQNIKQMASSIKEKSQKGLRSLQKKKGADENDEEFDEEPKKKGKKEKKREEDEFDEEPRRGRKRRDEEDDDFDEEPRRRRGRRDEEEEEEKPRRGRKNRYDDEEDEDDYQPRRPELPGRPPRPGLPPRPPRPELPGRPSRPELPGKPGETQPPADSKPKGIMSGFLSKFKIGPKAPRPEGPPPEAKGEMEERKDRKRYDEEEDDYQPRRGRRFEEEEDYQPRRGRRYEDEEEDDYQPRRGRRYEEDEDDYQPRRGRRYEEEEEEDFSEEEQLKRKKGKKKPRREPSPEAISSDFSEPEPEPEPEVPEGKPTPFHTGKRVPYIPLPTPSGSKNPFAKSCGNPFGTIGLDPPKPTPSPLPNTAFDAFAPPPPPPPEPEPEANQENSPKENEEDLPAEKPTPRPGFNPFAARQKNESTEVVITPRRRPMPRPGFNPFASTAATSKSILVNGKRLPNPFN